jgi:hypothetical protein
MKNKKNEIKVEEDLQEKEIVTDTEEVIEEVKFDGTENWDLKAEEVLTEEKYSNINKLKCDYNIFKRERDKCEMRVPAECDGCKKKFEKEDSIYVALGKSLNQIFICEDCAIKEQEK